MGIRSHPIPKALRRLNDLRKLSFSDVGYSYFADVRGDGTSRPSVWVVINDKGGVGSAHGLNGPTRAATLANIEAALAAESEA